MDPLARRLGFAPEDRVAIVHVDDIGMCHAANEGGFQALDAGPATCGSIMVPCGWFHEAAAWAREREGVDLGVHLTLNCEWDHYRWGPVAGRDAVPSLLDDEGFLYRTTGDVARNADPAEVEIELRAQIEMALAAGIDVTHIDSHMGTCFFPQFLDVYRRLGVDYGVPPFLPRPADGSLESAGLSGNEDAARRIFDRAAEDGLPILDAFDANSLGFPEGGGRAHNDARIEGLKAGVSYLICHAAKDGEELRRITPDSFHQRDFERGFYGGPEGKAALDEAGVRRIGMRELRDLYRKERASA